MFLWLAITLGRVIGLRDQRTLTLPRLYRHAMVLCVGGAVAMLVLLVFNRSGEALWPMVITYGVFNGPTLGYGYDLTTRVSPNPVTSTAVAMFGITSGASVVPFLASFLWDVTGWAFVLPLFVVISHVIPCFLVVHLKRQHSSGLASNRRRADEEDVSLPAPTPTFGAPPSPVSGWSPTGSFFEGEEEERGGAEGEGGALELAGGAPPEGV